MDNDSQLPEIIDPENIDIFLENIKQKNYDHQYQQQKQKHKGTEKCSVPDCKLNLDFYNTGFCVLCNKDLCVNHQNPQMHRCIIKLKTIQEQNLEESLQSKKQQESTNQQKQKQTTSSSFFVCCQKKKNDKRKS